MTQRILSQNDIMTKRFMTYLFLYITPFLILTFNVQFVQFLISLCAGHNLRNLHNLFYDKHFAGTGSKGHVATTYCSDRDSV